MAYRKSLDFLPEIFQTETNNKILRSTLDQLISEPEIRRLDGYIGRRFNPALTPNDSYILEDFVDRQDYQLEPAVVLTDSNGVVTFVSTYQDLLDRIRNLGGKVDDQSRLFESDQYNFGGLIDFDKFMNYSSYYWLPNGPDTVDVFATEIPIDLDITVEPPSQFTVVSGEFDNDYFDSVAFDVSDNRRSQLKTTGYQFDITGDRRNPIVRLARGGVYRFNVDQFGHGFYIQTQPGVESVYTWQNNLSVRDVLGVENNGAETGTVTFAVPQRDAQDFFVEMPTQASIDLLAHSYRRKRRLRYTEVQNATYSQLISDHLGIDGQRFIEGKTVAFLEDPAADKVPVPWSARTDYQEGDLVRYANVVYRVLSNYTSGRLFSVNNLEVYDLQDNWYDPALFDDTDIGFDGANFDRGDTVSIEQRLGWFRINIDDEGIVRLTAVDITDPNSKLAVNEGIQYGNREIYRSSTNVLETVPPITANLNYLYYQDALDPTQSGLIEIVDQDNSLELDVEEMLGRSNYTSPNGVKYENGLKIRFTGSVTPESYANKEYYIEGVGKSIELVPANSLLTPEPWLETVSSPYDSTLYDSAGFDEAQPAPVQKQYITINRSSQECSAWTRQNRWFHSSVIENSNSYNQYITQLNQNARAKRPIIEFEPNLQMHNFGRRFLTDVNVIDTEQTDALSNVEGVTVVGEDNQSIIGYYSDGVPLSPGYTVVFAADTNLDVRNKIWKVEWITPESKLNDRQAGFTGDGATTAFDLNFDVTDPVRLSVLINGNPASTNGYQWSLIGQDIVFVVAPPDSADISVSYSFAQQIHLVAQNTAQEGDVVLSTLGDSTQGTQWRFENNQWVQCQNKTSTNQQPLFELFDQNNVALSDENVYPSSDYSGNSVFAYKIGVGQKDPELGIRLSYRSINNVGDIVFEDNLTKKIYSYESENVNTTIGSASTRLRKNLSNGASIPINQWVRNQTNLRQKQTETFFATQYLTNQFKLNVYPVELAADQIQVYVNNQPRLIENYDINIIGGIGYLQFDQNLTPGDKVDVKVTSDQYNSNSVWEVPSNLQNNAVNDEIEEITLGQIRNHMLDTLIEVPELSNAIQGENNLKDLGDYHQYGGRIVQNAGAPHLANLFLNDPKANFIDSLQFAQREYQRFKNKFQQLSYDMLLSDPSDPVRSVDEIMQEYVASKGEVFAFYHSDMIPFGSDYKKTTYIVNNTNESTYYLTDTFSLDAPNSKAVLVYLNNTQLVHGQDYRFEPNNAVIELNISPEKPDRFATYLSIAAGDVLEIREYSNTDGCYVPETPTKLGLYPSYVPAIITDGYADAVSSVIRGHDGSLVVTYGDHRDEILLELEKRMYNNIKAKYNQNLFHIQNTTPGAFRETGYTYREFYETLSTAFNAWLGSTGVRFGDNEFFDSNDSFTWNYRRFTSRLDGEALPAAGWRGLYRYYYDTDQPHLRPWEMLGFTEQPSWWTIEYGPAPYTSGNMILWLDLEKGYIRQGERAGIDPNYARPGLNQIIPVNQSGELLSPFEAITGRNSVDVEGAFIFGDGGPIENSWRQSSEYPFAIQQALALLKPAEYFGKLRDTTDQTVAAFGNEDNLQWYFKSTGTRQKQEVVHGEIVNGEVQRINGYTTWISEYAHSQGLNPTTAVGDKLRNIELRLAYKMSGYTDKKYLKIFADQASPNSINSSVLIPDEDYQIVLGKSAPRTSVTYSGVIITRSGTGWVVNGYDTTRPYFIAEPPRNGGQKRLVRVDTEGYEITVQGNGQTVIVPYGTEFLSKQEVMDFLIGVGRYLESQGFKFEQKDQEDSAVKQDWWKSAQQFLLWTKQNWEDDIALTVSPLGNKLEYRAARGAVDAISNSYNGSRILDSNFGIVRNTDYTTNRDGRNFTLNMIEDQGIYLADINVVDYEHVLVFDNTTRFQDIVYQPKLGNRQYRLKITGFKSGAWDGTFGAPGFIINDNNIHEWSANQDYYKGEIVRFKERYYVAAQNILANVEFEKQNWLPTEYGAINSTLLPNLANRAGEFKNFYNFNEVNLELDVDKLSKGLIGFNSRDYLTDLGISDTSQVNFYKGSISQKGSSQSLDKMLRAKLDNFDGNASFYEQWAIRTGSYGTTANTQQIKFAIDEKDAINEFLVVQFQDNNDEKVKGRISVRPADMISYPRPWNKNFLTTRDRKRRVDDLPTAGYVRNDEIDYLSYNAADIVSNIDNRAHEGSRIWVANDENNEWAVYRVTQTDARVDRVDVDSQGIATIKTFQPHNLKERDGIYIKAFSGTNFTGYYTVDQVLDANSVAVQTNFNPVSDGTVDALIYKLINVRVDNVNAISSATPSTGWRDGDQFYVDEATDQGWAVYENNRVYKNIVRYFDSEATVGAGLGTSVAAASTSLYMLAGSPSTGRVQTYKVVDGLLQENVNLDTPSPSTIGFGTSLTTSDANWAATGSPDSNNVGHVHILRRNTDSEFFVEQVITEFNQTAGAEFGASLAMSNDARWLFVGSPGLDEGYVWVYQLVDADSDFVQVFVGNGSTDTFALTGEAAAATDVNQLKVSNGAGKLLVPYEDYYISSGNIVFFTPPGIEQISIRTKSYYQLLAGFTFGNTVGDRFGESLACTSNGQQLIIGSSKHDDGSTQDTGRVYVVDRTVEKQYSDGATVAFTTVANILGNPEVKINDVVQDPASYTVTAINEVTFEEAPRSGSIVSISTNNAVVSLVLEGSEFGAESGIDFGASLDVCPTNCSLFVGAPGTDESGIDCGAVHRWINQGRFYGTITGSVENPTTSGVSIIGVNDFLIQIDSGLALEQIAETINSVAVPGVVALTQNNVLTLQSDSDVFADKLYLISYSGDFFDDVGMQIYAYQQKITPPESNDFEKFGLSVRVNRSDATELAVGTERGNTFVPLTFDADELSFDGRTTGFGSNKKQSGAVQIYQLLPLVDGTVSNPSKFVFAEHITPGDLNELDSFGKSLDFVGKTIYAGAPGNDYNGISNRGVVFAAQRGETRTWNIKRSETPKVDLDLINSVFLYNKKTGLRVQDLDIVDPVKGRISGVADQDISYKTPIDPAKYSSDTGRKSGNSWTDQHVGELWWDISQTRWMEYEQDSIEYRASSWGFAFPGSRVVCYEWTESSVPPANYQDQANPNATAMDVSRYNVARVFDPVSGTVATRYYFWVMGKIKVPRENPNRRISAQQVEQLIANPRTTGLPFVSFLDRSTLKIHNINSLLNDQDVVLAIDYDVRKNNANLHSEYQLIAEGDAKSQPTTELLNKLIDSLAGSDQRGNLVPDPYLSSEENNGISVRPRQSMFVDRTLALKDTVAYINRFLLSIPAVYERKTEALLASDPYPEETEYNESVLTKEELGYLNTDIIDIGYLVLVKTDSTTRNLWVVYRYIGNGEWIRNQVQSYRNTRYINLVDWVDPNVNVPEIPAKTVDFDYELERLVGVKEGDFVKIRNNGLGLYQVVMRKNSTWHTVKEQNGTLQIASSIWNQSENQQGWDADGFALQLFDDWPTTEIRGILQALYSDVFVEEYLYMRNSWFLHMMRYALGEQKTVDWLFKTSLFKVEQRQRGIKQIPVYQQDKQDLIERYIQEVKPYHSKISEYVLSYDGDDVSNLQISDFDLPAYYSFATNGYRSPDGTIAEDDVVFDYEPYSSWVNNYKLKLDEIIVADGGFDYFFPPEIVIEGGGGTGATARAVVSNGSIIDVVITNPGRDYVTTPIVYALDEYGFGAVLSAKLGNDLVRAMDNTLIFDRVANSKGWLVQFRDFYGNPVDVRNERISQVSGQEGVIDQVLDLLSLNNWLVDDETNIVYPKVNVPEFRIDPDNSGRVRFFDRRDSRGWTTELLQLFIRSLGTSAGVNGLDITGTTVEFDGSYADFEKTTFDWIPGFPYEPGDQIVHNRQAYAVTNTFTAPTEFDDTYLTKLNANQLSVIDRIHAFYQPGDNLLGLSIPQLMSGVGYDVNRVKGATFDQEPGFDVGAFDIKQFDSVVIGPEGVPVLDPNILDQTLTSGYLDTALGTRPEDIITSGGGYLNHLRGSGPEEMVAAQAYDTLSLTVHTLATNAAQSSEGYSPSLDITNHVGDGVSKTFSIDSSELGDYFLVYTKNTGARYRRDAFFEDSVTSGYYFNAKNSSYTVDFENKNIEFAKPIAAGDLLSIVNLGQIGQNIVADEIFVGDGSTGVFGVTVDASTVENSLVLINGIETEDYQIVSLDNVAYYEFASAPAAGARIHIIASKSVTGNTISKINTQLEKINSSNSEIALDENLRQDRSKDTTVIVELNGVRLRPGNSVYYTGDGSTATFLLPDTAEELYTSLTFADVRVWKNSIKQDATDYVLSDADGSSIPTVTFFTAPLDGDDISITYINEAEYFIDEQDNKIRLSEGLIYSDNSLLAITSFSDHDVYKIKTKVFKGTNQFVSTQSVPIGFDSIGFDTANFDSTTAVSIFSAAYQIDQSQNIADRVFVTLDGVRLIPNVDYSINNGLINLAKSINVVEESQAVITWFSPNVYTKATTYRIFNDMNRNVSYNRIAVEQSTTLAKELKITDGEIHVNDGSSLSNPNPELGIPGVVFIGKERIVYYSKQGNVLSQLRRGTAGTGAAAVYGVGFVVTDAGERTAIPGNNNTTWYDVDTIKNTPSDGKGLQASDTIQAKFLRELTGIVPFEGEDSQ